MSEVSENAVHDVRIINHIQAVSPVKDGSKKPYPSLAVSWYATFVLAFLFWMSMLDRFIISLLIDPIKSDLGLTDVQFGLLQGMAFIVSYTVFGFIFGALADRMDRRRLIYIGVALWSIATAACGLAQNFWHLLFARAGLGAGEASLNPSATSMIADLFPREKLTSAMAVYSLGATVGGGTALMIGGAIIYWVSGLGDIVLPVIGQISTWQAVFFIVGLPGMVLALLVFTVREPVRRGQAQTLSLSDSWGSAYSSLFRFIRLHPRFFFSHYVGFMISAAAVTGCMAWYPVHMLRAYEWSEGRVGFTLGMTIMMAGIVGKLTCGWFVDRMYRKGYRDAQLRWYSICLLLAAPAGIIATTSSNPWIFLSMIALFIALNTSLQACSLSALNLVTPNQLRGAGVAVFTTLVGLVGGSGGMVMIPTIAETFYQGETSIGFGMATVIGIVCPIGALVLLTGLKAMRNAMAEVEGD